MTNVIKFLLTLPLIFTLIAPPRLLGDRDFLAPHSMAQDEELVTALSHLKNHHFTSEQLNRFENLNTSVTPFFADDAIFLMTSQDHATYQLQRAQTALQNNPRNHQAMTESCIYGWMGFTEQEVITPL